MSLLIGVDVGGTKIAAAAFRDGEPLRSSRVPTDCDSSEQLIAELTSAVQSLRAACASDGEQVGVGVGVPSVIEFATGRVRSSVNVPLRDVPLRELLSERLELPVFVDNDANVAALAEAYDGDRLVTENLVMITVGTGIGGGLVLNGRPYRGATGAAPEIGHMIIGAELSRGAPPPGAKFPQAGSFEALAAGTALDALAAAAARERPGGGLGRRAASAGAVTGSDVVDLAREGDEHARELLALLGARLGVGIANAINIFDPEEVVIGGGASRAGDLLIDPARTTARGLVLPGVGARTKIRAARYGNDAGARGAALLAGLESEAL